MKKNLIALAAAALAASGTAGAFEQEVGGVTLHLDNKLSAGASWRMRERDQRLVGIGNGGSAFSTNGDDGNLAFDKGDLVNSALKITTDFTVSRGNWGAFVRGSYLFSATLHNHDFFNEANYNPPTAGKEAPHAEFEQRTNDVRDFAGNDADLLDAYVFGSIDLGFTDMAVRVGQQVINWGESTYILNGVNSLLAFNANQVHVPGWELNEVIIPTNNVWVSLGLPHGISLEAFYQLDFRHSEPDAAGTFWSTTDFVGVGGSRANLRFGLPAENTPGTTAPRIGDVEPNADGQFGGKLSFQIPVLNEMETSLYAMNYHSRLPLFSGTSGALPQAAFGANYFAEYPKDIQLYGLSFNTTLGVVSVQGEYSYKVDQPLQLDDVELLLTGLGIPSQIDPVLGDASGGKYIRGWRRHDVSQFDLGMTYLGTPWAFLGEQLLVIGEVGGTYVHDLPDPSELAYEGPGTYTPQASSPSRPFLVAAGLNLPEGSGYPTAGSYGYKVSARLTYNNVFGLFKLQPTLRFDHDISGTTPAPLNNFVEDRKTTTLTLVGEFRQAWQGEVSYTKYLGGGVYNLLRDRDFVEAVLRYSF
jgi:hypothetical protein